MNGESSSSGESIHLTNEADVHQIHIPILSRLIKFSLLLLNQKTLSGSTASESGTPQSHQPKRSRRSSSRLLSESLCEITAIEPEVLVSLSELLSTHLHSLGSITSSFTRLNNRVYANRMDLSQSLTELSVSPQHLLDSFYQWIALSATQSLNSFSTSQEDEKTSFMSSSSLLGKRKPTTYLPSEEQANRVEKLEWINTLPQLPKLPPPHTYRLSQVNPPSLNTRVSRVLNHILT